MRALPGWACWALLCFLLTAPGGCDRDLTGPENRRIGPAGGLVSLADGAVTLSVPAGALSEEVWFWGVPLGSVPEADRLVRGSAYEIGPPGTTFALPVVLSITYEAGNVPSGITAGELGLFQVAGNDWRIAGSTSTDVPAHRVSGEARSLGRFSIQGLGVDSVAVRPRSSTLAPGDSLRLQAVALAQGGHPLSSRSIAWSTSDPSTAVVDDSGLVTGLAEGSATITASSEGHQATSNVTVKIPVASVQVTPPAVTLKPGQTIALEATPRDAGGGVLPGRAVTWTSNDEAVAGVDAGGRVTTAAVGSVTITATVEGRSGSATISVQAELSVAGNILADGVVGVSYNQTLAANGGDGTYSWSIKTGSLPAGLSLSPSSGAITGTPTAAGTSTFTVRVESADQTATKPLSISVNPVPVASVVVSPSQAALTPGGTRQFSATARDAAGNLISDRPISWASSNQTVASVSPSGLVTARAVGSSTITATVGGQPGWATVSVNNVLSVADVVLSDGVRGSSYLETLSATGGDGRYTWRIVAGRLPEGLALNASTGVISGTASQSGTASFIVEVSSTDGQSATKGLAITVFEPLSVATASLSDAVAGEEYEETLRAQGGDGSYSWALAEDTLPDGLSLDDETGTISGTPTGAGTATFTVRVASGDGQETTKVLSIAVSPVPVGSVEVAPASATVTPGQLQQLTAIVRDASGNVLTGRTVTWSSSDEGIATVDSNGLVRGLASGSTTITATAGGKSGPATVTVHTVLSILTSSLADGRVGAPYSQTLSATGGDGSYTWSLAEGTLPAGLNLDGLSGVISGMLLDAGTTTFTVQVESAGQTTTRILSIACDEALGPPPQAGS